MGFDEVGKSVCWRVIFAVEDVREEPRQELNVEVLLDVLPDSFRINELELTEQDSNNMLVQP